MAVPATFAFPGRWPPWIRRIILAGAWLTLAVYFYSPVRQVMDTSLDASNYASYAYFTAHGFQYGPEVAPMAGPYGFVLYGWTYSGNLFGTRTLCELFLTCSLAALTLWFFLSNRSSWWSWGWLAAHIAFTPFIEDLPIEWTILLAGLFLLQITPRPGLSAWTAPIASLLAFLSLVKGTHLILALAVLGVVGLECVWQRHWRRFFLLVGSYFAAFIFFWTLAGQNVLHIPAYLHGIRELAAGYNDAMSLEEPERVFFRGVLVLVTMMLSLGWSMWLHRRNITLVTSLILFAGYAFVQWKHGFVRADGHAYIFFHYAMAAAIAIHLAGLTPGVNCGRLKTVGRTGLLLATLLVSCYDAEEPLMPNLKEAPGQIVGRVIQNSYQLLHLSSEKSDFNRQLAEQSQLHNLPLVRQEVGHASIDLFGFEHGLIPLNHLNYHPRPMGGGAFNVYTPGLMRLNRDFLEDPSRRPAYYLLKIETIDYRLTAPDDGLALTDLLYRYQPLLVEHDHILLKALPQSTPPVPKLLSQKTFQFGDIIPVPPVGSHEVLLARFDISPNLLGRIREALYKLPRVRIGLVGHEIVRPEALRLVPAMASSPFIFSPVIEKNRDWLGLFTDRPGKALTSFRISTRDRTWFNKTIRVEFFTLPRPIPPSPRLIDELLPFTDTTIESISTSLPSGRSVNLIGQLMHPPEKLSWALNGDERSLSLGYGLIPAAYLDGTTDGVEFSAILQRPDQPPLDLFQRFLDPVGRRIDRGHHLVEIALPNLKPGSRIVITAGAGPHNNTAWDWAYLSEVHFNHTEYPASLFPGFNVVPVGLEAKFNSMSDVDGKRLFMVHAPSALTFALKGTEHSLQIDFGLLPGAYTGEGKTEGVDYVVEIIRAGQPAEEVFRHKLRPLTVPADRGQQSATIPLSNLKRGDQLVVRTTPGPSGNVSWAWAYLARLNLE